MKSRLIVALIYLMFLAFAGCQTNHRKAEKNNPVPVNHKFDSFIKANFAFNYKLLCGTPCILDTVDLQQTYFAPLKLRLYRFFLANPQDMFSIIEYIPENKYYVNSMKFEGQFYRDREYIASTQGCTSYIRKFNGRGEGFGVENCLNEFYKDSIISPEVFEDFVKTYTRFEMTEILKVENEWQLQDFMNQKSGQDKIKNRIFKSEIQKVIKNLYKPYFHVFIIYGMYIKVIELKHTYDFNSDYLAKNVRRFNLYQYNSYIIPYADFIQIVED